MVAAISASARRRGITVEEAERELTASVSICRIVTPEEVGSVIAFLASPRSVALNGDPILASGGALGPIHY